jgi:hypothetical protein
MPETLRGVDADRLARSCRHGRDSIRLGAGAVGVERAEVYLSTCTFEPHRHDTYAIGVTTAGVQTFCYRGSRRICLPGQMHILHPDETHDGTAGTEEGFGYRILYLAPALVHDALDGDPLPFVAEPTSDRRAARRHRRAGQRPRTRRDRRPGRGHAGRTERPARRRPSHDRRGCRRARARLPRDARARADADIDARRDRGSRPLHDRPPIPPRLWDEPRQVSDPAPPRARSRGDRARSAPREPPPTPASPTRAT